LIHGNHILCKKGKAVSGKCTYCPCPEQSNKHLFSECPVIRCFWIQIESLFYDVTGHITDIEKNVGRSGDYNHNPDIIAANHVILLSCQVIHKNNIEQKLPTTKEVAHKLMQLYYKENVYFSTKPKKKWNLFYDIWKNIAVCINKVIPFSIAEPLIT
jgi:hypothetical protein